MLTSLPRNAPILFTYAACFFLAYRALGYVLSPENDKREGWKIIDTFAVTFALLAIAASNMAS